MAKKKRNKWLVKALETMRLRMGDEPILGIQIYDDSDLRACAKIAKTEMLDAMADIEKLKENIKVYEYYIDIFARLEKQMEVEEYKVLNPHAKNVYYEE